MKILLPGKRTIFDLFVGLVVDLLFRLPYNEWRRSLSRLQRAAIMLRFSPKSLR